MKVEVYKLYDDKIKMLDTISTPTVSYKSRYFPPDGKFNSNTIDSDGFSIENKFDSKGSEYDFGSQLSNVVLDYAGPEFIHDYSKYTSFKDGDCASINIKFDIADTLGIDCEKFQIGFFYGTADEKILYESKHTFTEEDVPGGDLNWDNQFNDNYASEEADTYLFKKIVEESSTDLISYDNDWFVYRKGKAENYQVNFNLNFYGDSTDGTLGMLYQDMDMGEFKNCPEMEAGALYVKLWDLAGNEYVFTGFKPLMIIPWTYEEFIGMFDPLSLYFYDTYPADMFLQENIIGQSNILVENTNKVLSRKYGFETVLKLEDESPGYLVDWSKKVEDFDVYQEVDGIDSVGYVRAFAFLYTEKFDRTTTELIKNATLVKGSLGPWVKECEDNTRKINVDPFVPEFAKDTLFYHFCKFLENYLNTAWCPLDKDCRIGLLEKIARIGDFNDIDKAEFPVVQLWAEDRGNELEFDKEAVDAIKGMSKKYAQLDMDSFECIRYLYKNLPYINLYKGTLDCFRLIFNSLGITAELIPLWSKNTGEGSEIWEPEYFYDRDKNNREAWNKFINDTYYLSSHIELKVHGYLAYDLVDIAKSIVKLARSVLPVVRVIEYLLIEEISLSSNYLSLGYIKNSKVLADADNTIQCISFLWNCSDCSYRTVSADEIEVRIPQISERCLTDGASWWTGWSPTAGVVTSRTHNGIKISNNRTLNASKFFNMMGNTLKNNKVYTYVDYSTIADGNTVPFTQWAGSLIPLGHNKIDVVSINWESGNMILRVKMNSLAGVAQIDTAKFIIFTFVFSRNTGLCYTTDLKTALATPSSTGTLPGFKPYTWTKYKHEVIK